MRISKRLIYGMATLAMLPCLPAAESPKPMMKAVTSVVKKGGFIATLVSRLDQAELDKHGIRGASIAVKPSADQLGEIAKLIEGRKLRPIVTRMLPLANAVEAHRQAATHHTRGKMVLKVADEPRG